MSKELHKQNAKGIRWNTAMSILTFLTQFVALYFLNKIISPEDFGKAAWAISALSIGMAFSNLSFGVVAVRQKEVDDHELSSLFYISFLTNAILFVVFFFVLPNINLPSTQFAAPFLKAFGFVYLAHVFRIIPFVKMQRALQFDRISSINLFSKIASLTGAIYFSIKGQFFWALFFLYGGLQIFNCFFMAVSTKWSIRSLPNFSFLKTHLTMGFSFSIHQLITSMGANLDSILIGNRYGEQPVAEYHKSYGYRSLPLTYIATPISQVMFPTFSKLQDAPKKLSAFFMRAQNLTSFVLLPIYFLLFALAKPFTTLYFNENWDIERITLLLQIFSICGSLSLFAPNFYYFFSVKSTTREINTIVLSQGIITIVIILLTFKLGIIYVAYGILVSEVIRLLINIGYAKKYFYGAELKSILAIFFKTLFVSICSAFMGYLLYNHVSIIGTAVLHFIISGLLAGVSYLLLSYLFNRKGFTIFTETFLQRL